LAKKQNKYADEIDLTPFGFACGGASGYAQLKGKAANKPTCGSCHPGSGGLEFDRDGNRYDEHLAQNPSLKKSLDGDYFNSNWDKSGVLEADCFICHMPNYNFNERTQQFKKQNLKWVSTAASELASVAGAVANGETPKVKYNKRFFNDDGTVVLNLSWPPPDENCAFCHSRSDVKKRGFSWNDIHNQDIHQQQGMHCVTCHTAELDHQIAKGDANIGTVRDDLDNTMMGCQECHESGYMGATIPKHNSVRPSHLKSISCEACHIPQLNRTAALGFDASSGKLEYTTMPPGHKSFGELGKWKPIYEVRENGLIYPVNPILGVWFGNKDADGIIYPLFAREHKKGFASYGDQLKDDNEDGKPDINTQEEIILALKAYSASLSGNERFKQIHPVFMKGGFAYELDEDGNLIKEENHLASAEGFSINHNVAPVHQALGANGCQDCHSYDAHFFKGRVTHDMYDEDGKPIQTSIGKNLGCNATIFAINSFHQKIMSPLLGLIFMVVIFFIILHYHSMGPKHRHFAFETGEIKRFTLTERMVHIFRLVSFVLLAFTGLIIAFNATHWLNLFFSSYEQMLTIHIISGVVFIITTIWGTYLWFSDALFEHYDKIWIKMLGGYLGHKGEVPAGRFNAGQKAFYWMTVIFGGLLIITGLPLIHKTDLVVWLACLLTTIHNLVAFVMIAGVVAHAYLGTIANPGSWQVLVDGMVSKLWAEHHHPNWYRELVKEKVIKVENDSDKNLEDN